MKDAHARPTTNGPEAGEINALLGSRTLCAQYTPRGAVDPREDDQGEESVDEEFLNGISCALKSRRRPVANSEPAFWPATGMATKTLRESARSLRPIDAPGRPSRGHERQAAGFELRRDELEALIPATSAQERQVQWRWCGKVALADAGQSESHAPDAVDPDDREESTEDCGSAERDRAHVPCAMMYCGTLRHGKRPVRAKVIVTAGLRWPPDVIAATMRPNAMPRGVRGLSSSLSRAVPRA